MSRQATNRWDCGYCGQNVEADEWHSYESCVLYKLDFRPETLTAEDRLTVEQRTPEAMRDRVRRKELA